MKRRDFFKICGGGILGGAFSLLGSRQISHANYTEEYMKTIEIEPLTISVHDLGKWFTLWEGMYFGVPGMPLRHNLVYHVKNEIYRGRTKKHPRVTHRVFINDSEIWQKRGKNVTKYAHYDIRDSDKTYDNSTSDDSFHVIIEIKAACSSAIKGKVIIHKATLELMQPQLIIPETGIKITDYGR